MLHMHSAPGDSGDESKPCEQSAGQLVKQSELDLHCQSLACLQQLLQQQGQTSGLQASALCLQQNDSMSTWPACDFTCIVAYIALSP